MATTLTTPIVVRAYIDNNTANNGEDSDTPGLRAPNNAANNGEDSDTARLHAPEEAANNGDHSDNTHCCQSRSHRTESATCTFGALLSFKVNMEENAKKLKTMEAKHRKCKLHFRCNGSFLFAYCDVFVDICVGVGVGFRCL